MPTTSTVSGPLQEITGSKNHWYSDQVKSLFTSTQVLLYVYVGCYVYTHIPQTPVSIGCVLYVYGSMQMLWLLVSLLDFQQKNKSPCQLDLTLIAQSIEVMPQEQPGIEIIYTSKIVQQDHSLRSHCSCTFHKKGIFHYLDFFHQVPSRLSWLVL